MLYNRSRNRKDCMHKNCIDFHGNKGQLNDYMMANKSEESTWLRLLIHSTHSNFWLLIIAKQLLIFCLYCNGFPCTPYKNIICDATRSFIRYHDTFWSILKTKISKNDNNKKVLYGEIIVLCEWLLVNII